MGSRGGPAGPPTDETADLLALRKKLLEKKARLDQMLRQAGGGAPVASTGGKNGGGKGSQRYVFSRVIRHRTIAHPRRARFSGACANRFFFPQPTISSPPSPTPRPDLPRAPAAGNRAVADDPPRCPGWSPPPTSSRPSRTTR